MRNEQTVVAQLGAKKKTQRERVREREREPIPLQLAKKRVRFSSPPEEHTEEREGTRREEHSGRPCPAARGSNALPGGLALADSRPLWFAVGREFAGGLQAAVLAAATGSGAAAVLRGIFTWFLRLILPRPVKYKKKGNNVSRQAKSLTGGLEAVSMCVCRPTGSKPSSSQA